MTIALELALGGNADGRPAVVAPPHPLYGGRMDNPVVTTAASALADAGYATLRFNWRGVGRSEGAASGRIEDGVADYRHALDEALAGGAKHVLAAGYSFGAACALLAALDEERVERLVLVAPPVKMLDAVDIASFERPIVAIVGANDQFAPVDQLAQVLGRARDARLDVVPDADHFFSMPFWIARVADLGRAAV
jgi:hypothetical protein